MKILESWTWPAKAAAAYRIDVKAATSGELQDDLTAVVRWYGNAAPKGQPAIPLKSAYLDRAETGWASRLIAPAKAKSIRIDLHHWGQFGRIPQRGKFQANFQEILRPKPRKITLAVAFPKYPEPSTWDRNIEIMRRTIIKAGREKVDLLCLTETFPDRGVNADGSPQPCALKSQKLRPVFEAIKDANLHAVFTFHEKSGDKVYNTAVLVSPKGTIIGTYRKTHLTLPELDQGVTPGDEFPVFDTPLGKIGILVCWDAWFPASAQALARRGAEIICFPLAGDQYERHWQHVWPARAMDHQVFWLASVTANCVLKAPSAIIAPSGKTLALTREPNGIAKATVSLPFITETNWLLGAPTGSVFRNVIENSRKPSAY
jgi:predicted amidohydrolase